jgi:hypothetical protein
MTDWYYVENLEEFLNQIRKISYEKFLEVNQIIKDEVTEKFHEELDEILSKQESDNIALPLLKKHKDTYKVSEKTVIKIIEKLNSRMISNSLNKLVSEGVLESGFDSELNDFVFWIKEDQLPSVDL